jgi:HEAT repeat protein
MLATAGCDVHNAHLDAKRIAADIDKQLTQHETERLEVVVQKPILTALLGTEGGQVHEASLQETVADALARIGNDAVPALVAALSDHDAEVRAYACRALSVMGERASPAVPSLIERLSDSDENVRRSAARALGQIGPNARAAIPALIELMRNQKPPAHPSNRPAPHAAPQALPVPR